MTTTGIEGLLSLILVVLTGSAAVHFTNALEHDQLSLGVWMVIWFLLALVTISATTQVSAFVPGAILAAGALFCFVGAPLLVLRPPKK